MTEFRFAFIPAFLLLIPLVLTLIWWLSGLGRGSTAVMQYSDTRVLGGLPMSTRQRLRRIPDFFRVLAWVLLVVALAQPQSGNQDDIIEGQGIDISLALDISNSMAAQDLQGDDVPEENRISRMDAAKRVIRDFIENRQFDQIGLVVFGETAFYQSPPTLDYTTLVRILEDVPFAGEVGAGARTAIGVGLATSVNMLRESDNSKVIILLTDGTNNAGDIDPITAAETARAYDIRVYTIGIKTVDPDLPNSTAERTLRDIATITGGRYFDATNLTNLQQTYDEIDQLEGQQIELEIQIEWIDQAYWFIMGALIALLIERYLRLTTFQTIP